MNKRFGDLISRMAVMAPNYTAFAVSPNDALCCLSPFIFTWAIIDGIDETGYRVRWCYGSLAEAADAYTRWLQSDDARPDGFIVEK